MTDSQKVHQFINKLEHPLKDEIRFVREIILGADFKIQERVKWNAPSFYYKKDLVTFNPRNQKVVQLVFHHESIVKIQSEFLEGDYKDRRLMHFKDKGDIKSKEKELTRIMHQLVDFMDELEPENG
jgi:hypothetical protein